MLLLINFSETYERFKYNLLFTYFLLSLNQQGDVVNEDKQNAQKKEKDIKTDKSALLQKELAEKESIIQDYTSQLKRLQAEFENYVKRSDKERSELVQVANAKLISKLLVVLDNFNHAFEHLKKISASQEVINGVEMVSKEFAKILENEGLKEIHAKGCKFDPYLHEVITCVTKNDCDEDTVVDEVQKGYSLGSRTIRFAKVIVSKKQIQTLNMEGDLNGKNNRN